MSMPASIYAPFEVSEAGHVTAAQLRLAATHRYPLRKISIIPGIFEIHRSGRSHQISRASATAASAPPYWLPSLSRNFISSISSSRGIPSSAPTRESCRGATAIPRRRRHPDDLLKQAGHRRQELQHTLQPFSRVRVPLWVGLNLAHALRQDIQSRIDLPSLSLFRHDPKNLPHIFDRLKMVAPVAQHVYHAHDPPPLQLAQAGAHV